MRSARFVSVAVTVAVDVDPYASFGDVSAEVRRRLARRPCAGGRRPARRRGSARSFFPTMLFGVVQAVADVVAVPLLEVTVDGRAAPGHLARPSSSTPTRSPSCRTPPSRCDRGGTCDAANATIVPGSWRLGGDRWPWPSATATSAGLTVGAVARAGADHRRPPVASLAERHPRRAVVAADARRGRRRRVAARPGRPRSCAGSIRWPAASSPCPGWGGASSGAQRFGRRAALAATCGLLALADPDRGRVVVARTAPLLVRAVLEPRRCPAGRCRRPCRRASTCSTTAAGSGRPHRCWTGWNAGQTPAACPDGTWRRVVVDSTGRPWRVDDVERVHAVGGRRRLGGAARGRRPEAARACPRASPSTTRAGSGCPRRTDSPDPTPSPTAGSTRAASRARSRPTSTPATPAVRRRGLVDRETLRQRGSRLPVAPDHRDRYAPARVRDDGRDLHQRRATRPGRRAARRLEPVPTGSGPRGAARPPAWTMPCCRRAVATWSCGSGCLATAGRLPSVDRVLVEPEADGPGSLPAGGLPQRRRGCGLPPPVPGDVRHRSRPGGAEPAVAARALLPDRRAGCVARRAGCRARRAPRARLAPRPAARRCWSPHRAGTGGGARRRPAGTAPHAPRGVHRAPAARPCRCWSRASASVSQRWSVARRCRWRPASAPGATTWWGGRCSDAGMPNASGWSRSATG